MTDGGADRTRQDPEGPEGRGGLPGPDRGDPGPLDRSAPASTPPGGAAADTAEPVAASPAPALRWAARAGLVALAVAFGVLASVDRWYADEAFVPFRFGANLADGSGYTWNPGGPSVDGASSPGWVLVAALARATGADPVLLSWTAGVVAGLACLALVQFAGRRLLGLPPFWALCATASVALTRAFVVGATGALPTRVATLLAFAATLALVREARRAPASGRPWSAALFFAAALLRPDALLLHAASALALALAADARPARAAVLRSAGVQAALVLAASTVRYAIFGSAWPAALHVNVGGALLDDGLAFLSRYPAETFGALWGPVLLAGLALAASRVPDLATALLAQALALCTFVALAGGGGIEFLALDPLLPAFGLLTVVALRAILVLRGDPPTGRRRAVIAVVALALCGTQAATNVLPPTPSPALRPAHLAYREARRNVEEGQALAEHLRPGDRIATARTGAIPFITGAWHTAERDWPTLQRERVVLIDLADAFLFERAPVTAPRAPVDALGPGAFIHCLRLPLGRRPFFVFGSTLDASAIRAWAAERNLAHVASWPYAASPAEGPSIGAR